MWVRATRAAIAPRRSCAARRSKRVAICCWHGAAGAVVGAVLHLHTNGPLGQVARDGEAEFRMLAVAPEARGKRIGEALVRACIERAMNGGARAVVLWSQPTMPAAHRLYERLGFVRAPERDQEDVRGFTRLVFRKSLGCS
ncbi:MAG: GNAT family N-acetyltransferase [Flavobacteriales bacterium]|nr:GNAT family N-acetyltransferase [Flavobacteriales bacterium]